MKKNDVQKIIETINDCLKEFSKKFFKWSLFENKYLKEIHKKFKIEKLIKKTAK